MIEQCSVCDCNFDNKIDDDIPICEKCLELNSREYWEKAIARQFDDTI